MRELVFVNQNSQRWKSFEQALVDARKAHPDELAELYVQVTDDLAYARSYYPDSRVVRYLNGIAVRLHQQIYVNKQEKRGRIREFWEWEFPLLMFHNRRFVGYAFVIFAVAVLIGAVSAANDDRFVRLILGDGYVNMTLENIEQGDPMAVYKKMNPGDMFLGITYNNTRVMFLAFVLGVFFSAGTAYVLFSNGVMLGSFQYFFFTQGVLYESILSIWIHGTIEIFAIIVSGAAGMVLGNRMIFPGTYPRIHALRTGAKEGLKMAVGLVPFITLAGFLEGFVTRQTQWPDAVRIGIIVGSAALIVAYFFVYPQRVWQRMQTGAALDTD